jgi:hypothetical protein
MATAHEEPQPTTATSRWALAVELLEQAWNLAQSYPIVPGVTVEVAERNCREQLADLERQERATQSGA